ncbi:hypothetical protein LX36DRAFT_674367 [Colletotrichum falcatum]|nr:hypothetical protein LX36DRAFT_674367 [Colletotrichum falcatum]
MVGWYVSTGFAVSQDFEHFPRGVRIGGVPTEGIVPAARDPGPVVKNGGECIVAMFVLILPGRNIRARRRLRRCTGSRRGGLRAYCEVEEEEDEEVEEASTYRSKQDKRKEEKRAAVSGFWSARAAHVAAPLALTPQANISGGKPTFALCRTLGLANFIRGELASSLRLRNYNVNLLLDGVDPITQKPALYWLG